MGVPRLELVDRAWLAAHEPNLSSEAVGALFAPTAGIVSPYRLTYDMAENACANGVEIFTQSRALEIIVHSRSVGSPSFEVITQRSAFRGRYLVNAAGLWADDICRMAGIDDFGIHPRKGEEFILDKKKEHLTNHLLFPLPSRSSKGILFIKTADGNPMIGPTAEDGQDKEDLSTSETGLEKVLAGVRRMIPTVRETDIIAYFAGARPVAGDDFIIRRESKVPGFITVAGIQSPGLTASPAIALLVVDLLKEAGLSLKKKLWFRAHRRKTAHLFAMPVKKVRRMIRRDRAYGDIVCRCETVSAKEIKDAIKRGARTLDGIKFRTRAQAGRCHGSFCTTRVMKLLAEATGRPLTAITKKGAGSEMVLRERGHE